MDKYFKEIEKIISKNLDTRGMDKIKLDSDLVNTAEELNESDTVVIVTGFCVKDCKIGETDGPVGTLSLAHALENLGKKVIIVSDVYTEKLLKSSIESIKLQAEMHIITHENSEELSNTIITKYKPCHIIAVERPGRSKDGKSYSMRGEDITDFCPNTDMLFKRAKEEGIKTSAIGDGGNEVGMGKISKYVKENVFKGEQICAEVDTDNLIIAGVSNWGGHALGAILSIMNNRMLMYDSVTEAEVLQKIVEAGAVDGCTKQRVMSVDGLSLKENIEIFRQIREIAENVLIKKKVVEYVV